MQRVGVGAGRQRADDLLPQVVVRQVARQPVPRDRVEAPLEALAARAVVGDPGLRAVEVAVDGRPEMLVEREHERRRRRARRRSRSGSCRAEYRTPGRGTVRRSRRPEPTLGPMAPPGGYDRLSALRRELPPPGARRDADARRCGRGARTRPVLRRRRSVPPRRRRGPSSRRASQLIPRFRKRVMAVPLGQGRPVWVDHEGFDIAEHVHLTVLPAPGSRRQLLELAERLMTQVLDRDRPLWELWFVEGVDRRRARRPDPQVAPHPHRRHLGRRHRDRAARLQRRADGARSRRVGAGAGARPDPPDARQRPRAADPSGRARGRRRASWPTARATRWRVRPISVVRIGSLVDAPGGGAALVAQRAGRARPPVRDRARAARRR